MVENFFISLVLEKFRFLCIEYKFYVVQKDDYLIRFESNEVFLTVHYDASRSYELDVEIGQLTSLFNGQERPFNLGEILRTEGVAAGKKYKAFQAMAPDVLESCISNLALLVYMNAKSYLLNNAFSFKRLSDFREKECEQYSLKKKLVSVRRDAQVAWSNKDYLKVIALYKSIEPMINEIEKKKLCIAQKYVE